MKWLIKNPAPSDSRLTKWGDYHIGRSLTKYLTRLGQEVETQYDPGWGEEMACDVVLVLRGIHPFHHSNLHAGALRVMWNISHPAVVETEEYETYDLVLVASEPYAGRLGHELSTTVVPFLQCTDLEEFRPPSPGEPRRDIVFVGNTRGTERPAILWALDYGLQLRIWGRGWEQWSASNWVEGDYFPNENLGALYASSRATLNDHWDDMKQFGFINNRVFDALACGLPVISDWHAELERTFPSEVMFYRSRSEFNRCIERLMLAYPKVLEATGAALPKIQSDFSFETRTRQLVELVEEQLEAK